MFTVMDDNIRMILIVSILGLLLMGIIYTWYAYNLLKQLRVGVDANYSQVDIYIQKRTDLIPNLISVVKAYSDYESTTLTKLTEERDKITQLRGNAKPQATVNESITTSLHTVFAQAEAYPTLQSNEQYSSLQRKLVNLEDQIAFARQQYNNSVSEYNTTIQQFPSSIIASIQHASLLDYFEADDTDN